MAAPTGYLPANAGTSRMPRRLDVSLVCMPFGYTVFPFLGLSLLKAALSRAGLGSRVNYFNLSFANQIGGRPYDDIAVRLLYGDMVGDWLFSGELFDQSPARVEEFSTRFLPEHARSGLLAIREQVPSFLDECAAGILEQRPRIVGFTLLGQQMAASLALAARLKTCRPDVFVVFGGSCVSGLMGIELLRQFNVADAILCGEGEEVFPLLVERILDGSSIEDLTGVYTRQNMAELDTDEQVAIAPLITDLDALPFPDHDDYYEQLRSTTLRDSPFISFETARGCWWGQKHHCVFCGLNRQGISYRSKSAARALEEVRYLKNRHKLYKFFITDDILDIRYFSDFLPGLQEQHPDVTVNYEIKSNLTKQQVRQLRASGVVQLQAGIESLSSPILRLMNKGVTGIRNIQTLKWCEGHGITVNWNFLYGFPGEERGEYEWMASLLPSLAHLRPPNHTIRIVLKRFSPYYRERERLFKNIQPSPEYAYIYPFDDEVLAKLAFDFTYELHSAEDPDAYAKPIVDATARWKENYEHSSFTYGDTGTSLLLFDLRPNARALLTTLEGTERVLYLECDRIRTPGDIVRRWDEAAHSRVTEDEVRAALDSLVDRCFMVAEGDSYLSLAIPLGEEYELTEAKADQLAEAIVASEDGAAAFAYLGVNPVAALAHAVAHATG